VNQWRCIILAAGRGPQDPMAKAFGVAHKCTLPLAGKPMLAWVVEALHAADMPTPYVIVIDDAAAARRAVPDQALITTLAAAGSAPASALEAALTIATFPLLITTGDHPLLTAPMIRHCVAAAAASKADFLVGLATSDVIQPAYPETRRTYFNLGGTRVSGCNLFVVRTPGGLKLLETWQHLEQNRKKPWKLVFAFGLMPLLWYALGKLTPARAFAQISNRLGIAVAPIFLPFAEAAMDVDKPSDHAIAEQILKARSAPA
jgi:CTP:molybdopterin cytidylyltransferase MocA